MIGAVWDCCRYSIIFGMPHSRVAPMMRTAIIHIAFTPPNMLVNASNLVSMRASAFSRNSVSLLSPPSIHQVSCQSGHY